MSEAMTVELFRKMVDRLPGAITLRRFDMASGKNDLLYLSPNAPAVYGLTEAEMRAGSRVWLQRIAPEERAVLEGLLASALEKMSPIEWVGPIGHPNGETRWIELRGSFEREAGGAILSFAQAIDVTARKRTEEALVKSEEERHASDALHRAVIEALPIGVCVMAKDGSFPIINAAQQSMAGPYDEKAAELRGQAVAEHFGMFEVDGVTPLDVSKSPLVRTITGDPDVPPSYEYILRNPMIKGERRVLGELRAIRDEAGEAVAAVMANVDVTAQRALEKELLLRNEQLAASEEAKTALIERLRLAIDELSNPILEVWDDVLAMPIVGLVDSRRTADMVRRLLAEVARTQATFVIVDLTGVEIVDTRTADHLIKLMRKVEIVGARCVLTGVRPAVAETLVDIGVDFGRLPTLRNLKHGLREALRHARREREGLRDVFLDDEQNAKLTAVAAR